MIFVHKASVFCLLTLLFAGCASPPHTPDGDARMRANELLRTYSTKAALSEFVGSLPERCFQSSAVTELCQWSAAARQTAWQPMARAIETEDGVNLICELPVSAEPRSPGSCSIHPRRSNRYSWKSPNTEPAWAARRALERSP